MPTQNSTLVPQELGALLRHDGLALGDLIDDQSGRDQGRQTKIARHDADSPRKPALRRHAKSANVSQTPNSVPLLVAVGEKSFFTSLLPTFVDGHLAKGMTRVESERFPGAGHYVVADNPDAVAELIGRYGGR